MAYRILQFPSGEEATQYKNFVDEQRPWGKFPYSAAVTYQEDVYGPQVAIEAPSLIPIAEFFEEMLNRKEQVWEYKAAPHQQQYLVMAPRVRKIIKDTIQGMRIHHKNNWCCGADDLEVYIKGDRHAIPIFSQRIPNDKTIKRDLIELDIWKFHNMVRNVLDRFQTLEVEEHNREQLYREHYHDYWVFKDLAAYFESQNFPATKTIKYMLQYEDYISTGPLCWNVGDKFRWFQVVEFVSEVVYGGVYVFRYQNLPIQTEVCDLTNWPSWIRSPTGNCLIDLHMSSSKLKDEQYALRFPVFVMYYKDYRSGNPKYVGAEGCIRFFRNAVHHISDTDYFAADTTFIQRLEVTHAEMPKVLAKLYYVMVTFYGTRKITDDSNLYDVYLNCNDREE